MGTRRYRLLVAAVTLQAVAALVYYNTGVSIHPQFPSSVQHKRHGSSNVQSNMVIVLRVCDSLQTVNQTITLMKSLVAYTRLQLRFVIFVYDPLRAPLKNELLSWPIIYRGRTSVQLRKGEIPEGLNTLRTRVRSPCSLQLPLLPKVLWGTDAVLSIDSDTVFLSPVERLWDYFKHTDTVAGTLQRKIGSSNAGPLEIGTELLLMNLTRMRARHWVPFLDAAIAQRKGVDIDIKSLFTQIAKHGMRRFLSLPKQWTYGANSCQSSETSPSERPPALVRGFQDVYSMTSEISVVYHLMEKIQLGESITESVMKPLMKTIVNSTSTTCSEKLRAFLPTWTQVAERADAVPDIRHSKFFRFSRTRTDGNQ
ncbi:glucoside xylosyltransferase 1-like [Ornithodoros turicata]|uniref:glucoside xylosyltransferase 1-like n=1 Tax=Ornithodoros turicata TaxID=34597 RepID=UPI00313960AE